MPLLSAAGSLPLVFTPTCGPDCNCTSVSFPMSGLMCSDVTGKKGCCSDFQSQLCKDNGTQWPLCSSIKGGVICPGNTGGCTNCNSHATTTTGIDVGVLKDSGVYIAYDGLGGLSGGGATSNFIQSYAPKAKAAILDLLFSPGNGASLDLLKVEIGSDDETTNGCEACHMRTPTDIDCNRGYEWALMKEAKARNPGIALYGLPWNFPGWIGAGSKDCDTSPAFNYPGQSNGQAATPSVSSILPSLFVHLSVY